MEPNAFIAEVYRRMSLCHRLEQPKPSFTDIKNDARVLQAVFEYAPLLPCEKSAAILDIGFGGGETNCFFFQPDENTTIKATCRPLDVNVEAAFLRL